MDGSEAVIEEIQVDAASESANTVGHIVEGAILQVDGDVLQVGATLEEHAENSETRHEEILGDTEWIRTQLEQLSLSLTTLLTTVTAMQIAILAAITGLQTTVESTVTRRSNPETPPEILVIDPVPENADVLPEAKTETEKPPRRRRMI